MPRLKSCPKLDEKLVDWYVNQKLSCKKIAKILGCNDTSVHRRLRILNVKMRNVGRSKHDLTGKKMGGWKILRIGRHYKYGGWYWFCECIKCGKKQEVFAGVLKRISGCKKCFDRRGNIGDLSKKLWCRLIANAVSRQLEVSIDRQHAWELFIKQNKKCALTGIDLIMSNDCQLNTASLDRIDSNGNYTEDNVWWVHKKINKMKWSYSVEEFIELCELVTRKAQSDKSINNNFVFQT